MGRKRVLAAWLLLWIAVAALRPAAAAAERDAVEESVVLGGDGFSGASEAVDSGVKAELEQLRARIADLELNILEKAQQQKIKDQDISKLEEIIQQKSDVISSLQSDISSLQERNAEDAKQAAGKANTRASKLEKEIDRLKADIESQNARNDVLGRRASDASKKEQELNLKLESLLRTIDEQNKRIQKTERALQVAEKELLRVQLEEKAKSIELTKVNGAWLPPWLASQAKTYQELMLRHWNEHGKPAIDIFVQHASEKLVQAQVWAEPHWRTTKNKVVPFIEEQWNVLRTNAKPHIQRFSSKSVEVFKESKNVMATYVLKGQQLVHPYVQNVRRLCKPYVDQAAEISKPHIEKTRVFMKPYTKRVTRTYRKLSKVATTYHYQVQNKILNEVAKHEVTKSLANKEVAWFLACALFAIPVFFVCRALVHIFCSKKPKKAQKPNAGHAHRKQKRRHTDK